MVVASLSAYMLVAANAHAGAILDGVKKKGYVQCGISDGLPGFSFPDAQGHFHGFDVDVCRAVAAAVLGDSEKVHYTQLNGKERFSPGKLTCFPEARLGRRHVTALWVSCSPMLRTTMVKAFW